MKPVQLGEQTNPWEGHKAVSMVQNFNIHLYIVGDVNSWQILSEGAIGGSY